MCPRTLGRRFERTGSSPSCISIIKFFLALVLTERWASRGCSSVGRAIALQAKGREFDSPQLHQQYGKQNGPVAQLVRACA